jgi:hypothetical protein
MVAPQENHVLVLVSQRKKRLQDGARVLASVHIVTQEDQFIFVLQGAFTDDIEQLQQHRVLAVDVAYGIDQCSLPQQEPDEKVS